MTNHYFDCQVLLVNKMIFDSMPADVKRILQEEAVKAQNLTRQKISQGEAAVVKELQAKGMNVTYPDRQSFVAKMAPAYEKVGALAGQAEMKKLLEAVEKDKAAK